MISFYPGPSKVYPQIRQYLTEAYDLGILERNHRSSDFENLCQNAIELFKEKMNIPTEYRVFFVSSATESWEIIAQSFSKNGSLHFYNGAFGEKWAEYTHKITQKTQCFEYNLNQNFDFEIAQKKDNDYIVCLTHSETSNGTFLRNFPKFKHNLLALDATSSLGGLPIDWHKTDIVFASVQKCLGLPAGLAVMIFSPKALDWALQVAENQHYNSFLFLEKNFQKFQTPHTPNVLGIFLFKKVMENLPSIATTNKKLEVRFEKYYKFFKEYPYLQFLSEKEFLSPTVLCLQGNENFIKNIKNFMKKNSILLGNGYGKWKENTIRIANFPAIDDNEIDLLLQKFLEI